MARMKMTNVGDMSLLGSARMVLRPLGIQLDWTWGEGYEIRTFHTGREGQPLKSWDEWDAELGSLDLAYLVKLVIGL